MEVGYRMDTIRKKRKHKMSRKELEEKLRDLIPQRELARLLGVTPKTIIGWNTHGINGSTLPKIRIGRQVYYRPDDVDRFQKLISGGK